MRGLGIFSPGKNRQEMRTLMNTSRALQRMCNEQIPSCSQSWSKDQQLEGTGRPLSSSNTRVPLGGSKASVTGAIHVAW